MAHVCFASFLGRFFIINSVVMKLCFQHMTNVFTVPSCEHAASRSYPALPKFSLAKWHSEFWTFFFLLTDYHLA